jgi:hypothetical protein
MASVAVTSTKEIRCPIDVVRAQFGDIKHDQVNSVHRKLELTLHAEDERGRRLRLVWGSRRAPHSYADIPTQRSICKSPQT